MKLILLALFLLWGCPKSLWAENFQVAVAANFSQPAKEIAAIFEAETGHRPLLSVGSTGNFYTQIINGAPFALFLAADEETPARLEASGLIKPKSRFTYAQGALVLWGPNDNGLGEGGEILKGQGFSFLAVTNPKLSPYGRAAYELINAWALTEPLKGRTVTGNNVGQTFHFAKNGQAELALIAKSQVYRHGEWAEGAAWLVPENLYSPIRQQAVVLSKGAESPAALAFADYIKNNPKAREIMLFYGYEVP
ncbi:MAG: molybdate ABC transporter substrate-binding protein [Candidatus Adiutrix sp.]